MNIIPRIAKAMQCVLTTNADETAREMGVIKRQREFTGSNFAQTLVFGWLDNPDASLGELAQTAISLGAKVSPQGLEQRFTQEASDFLKKLLEDAVSHLICADPVSIPILKRFNGVYIQDSSVIVLPDEVSSVWQGCGGRVTKNTRASVKLNVRLNMSTGELSGPHLQAGRVQDKSSCLQKEHPPAGSLRIADLGYFSLKVMGELSQMMVYWLSRINSQCVVFDQNEKKWDLVELMEKYCQHKLEMPILLGVKDKLPCRLMAVRVPDAVANERRRKMKAEYRREGKTPSKRQLDLANWTVLVTNVSREILSLDEAFVLIRVRWQIELLFKLWKSYGRIDKWRSKKPLRILCELYAKLIAMIIQHWVSLSGSWSHPDRSLHKAAQTIHKHAINLAIALNSGRSRRLHEILEIIQRCLDAGCRLNKRRKKPNTYQLLLQLDDNA